MFVWAEDNPVIAGERVKRLVFDQGDLSIDVATVGECAQPRRISVGWNPDSGDSSASGSARIARDPASAT